MRIAIFDSGVGGITVLREALALIPGNDYIYYADTRNVPYGIKPKNEVKRYILDAVEFLSGRNIQAMVVACNTATSVAIDELRKRFDFPILGMEPAIKPAILNNTGKKILVLATSLTLCESKLETLIRLLDKNQKVEKLEMNKLVEYAEIFDFSSDEVKLYLKEKLLQLPIEEYETIVLGCTHFIYYKRLIEEIVGKGIAIIDGNEGTVRNLVNMIQKNYSLDSKKETTITFYSSGIEDTIERRNRLLKLMHMETDQVHNKCFKRNV